MANDRDMNNWIPDDHDGWKVKADWLVEQGDPAGLGMANLSLIGAELSFLSIYESLRRNGSLDYGDMFDEAARVRPGYLSLTRTDRMEDITMSWDDCPSVISIGPSVIHLESTGGFR